MQAALEITIIETGGEEMQMIEAAAERVPQHCTRPAQIVEALETRERT